MKATREADIELEEAEAAFIAATRRLDRLRAERGLGHLGLEDLATGEDTAGDGDEQTEGQGQGQSDPAHGEPPVGAGPSQPTTEAQA